MGNTTGLWTSGCNNRGPQRGLRQHRSQTTQRLRRSTRLSSRRIIRKKRSRKRKPHKPNDSPGKPGLPGKDEQYRLSTSSARSRKSWSKPNISFGITRDNACRQHRNNAKREPTTRRRSTRSIWQSYTSNYSKAATAQHARPGTTNEATTATHVSGANENRKRKPRHT